MSRTSNVFQDWRMIVKYTTMVTGQPASVILPHEDFYIPFVPGTAEPTDPDYLNIAMYSIVGRCV